MTPDALNLYTAGLFTDAEHERAKAWAATPEGSQVLTEWLAGLRALPMPVILHDNKDIHDPEGE